MVGWIVRWRSENRAKGQRREESEKGGLRRAYETRARKKKRKRKKEAKAGTWQLPSDLTPSPLHSYISGEAVSPTQKRVAETFLIRKRGRGHIKSFPKSLSYSCFVLRSNFTQSSIFLFQREIQTESCHVRARAHECVLLFHT